MSTDPKKPEPSRILIVDDELSVRELLAEDGLQVQFVVSVNRGCRRIVPCRAGGHKTARVHHRFVAAADRRHRGLCSAHSKNVAVNCLTIKLIFVVAVMYWDIYVPLPFTCDRKDEG